MTLERVTCWTVTCDSCGDGWQGEVPHLLTRQGAVIHARDAGWGLNGTTAWCQDCQRTRACAMEGHRWGQWSTAGPFPRKAGGQWRGRVRHCLTGSAADWDPPVGSAG